MFTPEEPIESKKLSKFLITFIILGGLVFGVWYYRSPIINLWDSLIKKEAVVVNEPIKQQPVNYITNCGTSVAPKLGVNLTSPDSVLSCLGVSALNCQNATGILKDDLFPTIFEITKSGDSCFFKLSYGKDSVLVDATGKKSAGQYISCPVDIVRAIDNVNSSTPKFIAPDKTDLSKYAKEIYLYGTLGLFVEQDLDQNKIQVLGCSGEYIKSVIAGSKSN
jgi:hypothetical protein